MLIAHLNKLLFCDKKWQGKHCLRVKVSVDFDVSGKQGMDFFIIYYGLWNPYFSQKQLFKVKIICLIQTCSFSHHKTLNDQI